MRPLPVRRWVAAAAVITLSLLLGACSGSSGASDEARITGGTKVPLKVDRSRSDVRATIATTISGESQNLLFDTGSTGLSVLATAVPSSVASMTGDPFQESFVGGVALSGVVVSLPVEVAGIASNGPIMVRIVQTATCSSNVPNCSAKDGIDGFAKSIDADGIFGAGLWATGSVYSPLTQLAGGVPSSIAVSWGGSTGSVTFDPTIDIAPVATLSMAPANPAALANGAKAWNNLTVPICWQIESSQRTCTATALDTGAAAMSFPIGFPGGPTTNVKELSSRLKITATTTATAEPFLEFSTGRKLGENLVTVIPGQSFVNSGLRFFDQFVVVFSLSDGTVRLYSGT